MRYDVREVTESSGDISEEPGDVGKAKEGLENEL